ncbi:amidohydrolase family protein [Streptodolium elevatio]|uniref:Amidohydrolase family protein n=1 Tax=Streptodolium elevatio TaxID=3157996 RepID=A0ABV3DM02_9ACTN
MTPAPVPAATASASVAPAASASASAGVTPAPDAMPLIISVDDHVLEPRDLWQNELPAELREQGPRVVREKVKLAFSGGNYGFERNVEDGQWCDVWVYDDLVFPTGRLHAPAGFPEDEVRNVPAIYEDFRPGVYDQAARLADMDVNHVEAAVNFPNTFPRFCGQGFAERKDKDLAYRCLRIYNDWMIDEWSAGAGRGRLIPLTLVPLWDPQLAAAEVRRCAAKGSYAIAFSENPHRLGFASMHSGEWDVLWAACQETGTAVTMHIGSSSHMPSTSPDAPLAVSMALSSQNAQGSLMDWIFSGTLARFPALTIAYAESQVGWMPYLLERADLVWRDGVGGVDLPDPPSSYVKGRVYGCVFDDQHGLISRESVGMRSILFETDYPHSDGTWPNSRAVAHRLCEGAGMNADEVYAMLRGNAIRAFGLERFGITS